jgi:hypothetical protein
MTSLPFEPSTRFARWWVRRYTAGLPDRASVSRRAEIDSDLVEHARCREDEGWTASQITRERLRRLVRGGIADLRWRNEVISEECRAPSSLRVSVTSLTSIATVVLATYHFLFASFILGNRSVAERRFLSGMEGYEDEIGRSVASAIAALILGLLGLVLLTSALARPVSPLVANVVTMAIGAVAVLFFWLGIWPIGIVAVVGSIVDLAIRTPHPAPQP